MALYQLATGANQPSDPDKITIHGINKLSLISFLRYSGQLNGTEANAESLLLAMDPIELKNKLNQAVLEHLYGETEEDSEEDSEDNEA